MSLDNFVLNGRCQHGECITTCPHCLNEYCEREMDGTDERIERPDPDPWQHTRAAVSRRGD